MIDRLLKQASKEEPKAQAALERAAARALELGRQTGTPVLILQGDAIMDIASEPPRLWKKIDPSPSSEPGQ